MPLAGDFRPYFTIHDKDHAALVNQNAPQAGLLLGVTNPFYEGTCKHWPHQLSLGNSSQLVPQRESNAPPRLTIACRMRHPSLGNHTPLPGPLPGWKTKTHRRYISKDRSLLKVLEQAVLKSDSEARTSRNPLKNTLSAETPFRKGASSHSPTSLCLAHNRIPRPVKPIP